MVVERDIESEMERVGNRDWCGRYAFASLIWRLLSI
jgi:hypothetical protein